MRARDKAKGIQPGGSSVRPPVHSPSTALSPSLDSELRASWERVFKIHKAETVGAELDLGRSRVYEIAGHPGETQFRHLFALAEFDYDPEFISRLAHVLLAWAAARAARRKAEGGRIVIIDGQRALPFGGGER